MRRGTVKLVLFILAFSFLALAQEELPDAASVERVLKQESDKDGAPKPVLRQRDARYQICPGDKFDLTFSFTPEFNQSLIVQPDGFVTLQGVGDINVKGKTIPEVTASVTAAYAKILQQPNISVILREFEKPHFVVIGEVRSPGKFELRADTTVTEGVAVAGGFTERAKHSQVLLFRRVSDDWMEVKKLDLKAILNGDFREDVHLIPGDMLFVPQNTMSKVRPFIPVFGGIRVPVY